MVKLEEQKEKNPKSDWFHQTVWIGFSPSFSPFSSSLHNSFLWPFTSPPTLFLGFLSSFLFHFSLLNFPCLFFFTLHQHRISQMANFAPSSSAAAAATGCGSSSGAAIDDAFEDACSICLEPFTAQDPSTVWYCFSLHCHSRVTFFLSWVFFFFQ